ncbi:SoxR reducing system RseC family protein [Thaumasiovibrio subtropicus]|uniref:SoxR reducing system RseC family protein n=1 Tax=Thaumasiovibrio subtropicus TaxID=1891207 RepID=UPI000B36086D|nr:SoxR reducing system RseC family protein [Thaumasiovibrio subtropicus]
MMTSLATVVGHEPDAVIVSCQQQSSCGHCSNRDSCGTGIVSKVLPGKQHQIRIETPSRPDVGHIVEIGLPEESLLRSAFMIYLVPLLGLIFGAIIGQWWFVELANGSELGTIASAFGFGALSFVMIKRLSQKYEQESAYKPRLLRVFGAPVSANLVINATDQDSE